VSLQTLRNKHYRQNTIVDYFKRVGVELTDVRFEGIDTTPSTVTPLLAKDSNNGMRRATYGKNVNPQRQCSDKLAVSRSLGAGMVLIHKS
jgi:hypothetical protein